MPFRLPDCPKGWDKLPDVEGRFIVGRGTFANPPPSKASVGSYSNTLTVGETGGNAERWGEPAGALTGAGEYRNFPPYIVYTYCVKS